jgi:hypothetical protein
MKGCLGGCLGRAFALLILAGIIGAAWHFGPTLYEDARGVYAEPVPGPTPSLELAAAAEERVQGLLDGIHAEISLAAVELESLIHFRLADGWPDGVSLPTVSLRDDELHLGFRLAHERLPNLPELDGILGFLPDTVPVQLRGRVLALSGGEAALLVHRIDAASIPIPRRFFQPILDRVQPRQRADLPPEALFLPLPAGIRSARVDGDRLVLTRLP